MGISVIALGLFLPSDDDGSFGRLLVLAFGHVQSGNIVFFLQIIDITNSKPAMFMSIFRSPQMWQMNLAIRHIFRLYL